MKRVGGIVLGATLAACAPAASPVSDLHPPLDPVVSGYTFLTADTKALQDDDFSNPGFLWVDRGEALFHDAPETGQACASCHQEGLVGVAARYPAIDASTGALLNVEGRINQCRERHQTQPALAYESEDLLALTAYIAAQSRGAPISVKTSGPAARFVAQGEAYFQTQRGQFNLSCGQCHNENWGKQLRGDTLSQGHLNGFPAYRLEWQSLGSSHRRLRDCDIGVRAEPLPYGDPIYIALELYLAARAQELPMESPAVRR